MIKKSNSLIYKEFDNLQLNNFFDLKDKKFLHNIDTFYYSVKLDNDFTSSTDDLSCLSLRSFFQKVDFSGYDTCVPFVLPGCHAQLNIRPFTFARFYNINIECPDLFDIFISPTVPGGADGSESVTSEIIVQLRSYLLWQFGPTKAFEYSYDVIQKFCDFFKLTIKEVKENRVDYCWHSNYLQNPERFFNIEKFANMQVSRYKSVNYHYTFKAIRGEVDNDYIALGKRSDKCFVRIYNKTKEVVEMGYKPWFLKEWLFNNLINRFDFYCYEKAVLKRNWEYVDIARLEFYIEFGSDQNLINRFKDIVSGQVDVSSEQIARLADSVVPRTTLITNVEYQTMRKMSKSFCLKDLHNNKEKGATERIYTYLDCHSLITEYLTRATLRLVEPASDINISRCDYCAFWKALRSCKLIDVRKSPKHLKLVRDYTRKISADIVKKRAISSISSYCLYMKGLNDDTEMEDAAYFISMLNDNDINQIHLIKHQRQMQLSNLLLDKKVKNTYYANSIRFFDSDSGEFI